MPIEMVSVVMTPRNNLLTTFQSTPSNTSKSRFLAALPILSLTMNDLALISVPDSSFSTILAE